MNKIFNRGEEKKDNSEDGEENVDQFTDNSMRVVFGFEGVRLRLLDSECPVRPIRWSRREPAVLGDAFRYPYLHANAELP